MKTIYILLFLSMNALLELIFLIGYPILRLILPFYQYTESIKRMPLRDNHPILIHAASVGEINAVVPLIKELIKHKQSILINTFTVSGKDRAKELFPKLEVRLAPLDLYSLRISQLRAIKPKLILIVETEIWPNLLYAAGNFHIPVIFINARISAKTLSRYLRFGNLLRLISPSVTKVLAQSELDQERLQKLFPIHVENAGNLKYCLNLPAYDTSQVRSNYMFNEDDFIIVWGSSRPREEELIVSYLPLLRKSIPNLRLILAPRHPKRSSDIARLLKDYDYVSYSEINQKRSRAEIVLIDTLGHLTEAYSISDISIVGGSFYDFGGHNPLEPAFYGKCIIMGEYYSSCRDSVQELLKAGAIILSSRENLPEIIIDLYRRNDLRDSMGQKARLVLKKNATALSNHMRGIMPCLK
nr:3-deoxy-D-manno-octulosonic-acid transferase [Candidatus Cloacimonadota bacterium]